MFVLIGWEFDEVRDGLCKIFVFIDFVEVFGFMVWVVLLVEKVDYYFEWLNVWNWVDIFLIMYDVGGLLIWDVELVEVIEYVFV